MKFAVKSLFRTIQGEGYWTGVPSVFVRLVGCNLWSGDDVYRERDATRNGAVCPRWCDTDFTGPPDFVADVSELAHRVQQVADGARHVVVTGGEPLLQLRDPDRLARELGQEFLLAVETNGTIDVDVSNTWITCSPKVAPDRVALRRCAELKVVVPGPWDPESYRGKIEATFHFVQPVDLSAQPSLVRHRAPVHSARDYVLAHPKWRLGLQAHKIVEAP